MSAGLDFILDEYISSLKENGVLKEVLAVAREGMTKPSGKIWLIGSSVYKTPKTLSDLDILVEGKIKDNFNFPRDWTTFTNKFGNMKFRKEENDISVFSVSYIPLDTAHNIERRKKRPTIENYLTGVPLNIQSIALDVTDQSKPRFIGKIGMKAMEEKTVRILDIEEARHAATIAGVPLVEYVNMIADSLGYGLG